MKRAIIIIITIYTHLSVLAASDKYNMAFYDRWDGVASDELLKMGSDFQGSGKPDSAMVCYTIIANRYHEDTNDKPLRELAAKAMFGIGYLYMYDFYNYEQAYNYMQKSMELSELYGFKENLPYTYLNIANITCLSLQMSLGGESEKNVLNIYNKALRTAEETEYWEAYIIIIGNMLELAFDSSDPKQYVSIVAAYKKKSIPHSTPRYFHVLYECMAFEAYAQKEYDKALRLLDKSGTSIDNDISTIRCKMRINEQRGKIYQAKGMYADAYRELKTALEMAQRYKAKDAEMEFCKKLYKLCLDNNDNDDARKWQLLYYQKKDSLMAQGRIGNIDRIRFLNQINKINQQVIEVAQKRRMEHTILYALAFTTAITLGFSIALARKNKRLRQRNHKIFLNSQEAIKKEVEEKRMRLETQHALDQTGKEERDKKPKYRGSNLTANEKKRLNEELLRIFDDMDEVCSDSFSVNRLAELTNSTYKNVSQIINEMHEMTFKQLVSKYRIQEACRRLTDKEHFGNLTIEGIAESVGFKSRSSFVQAFKREVGISPSEYQKEANDSIKSPY